MFDHALLAMLSETKLLSSKTLAADSIVQLLRNYIFLNNMYYIPEVYKNALPIV